MTATRDTKRLRVPTADEQPMMRLVPDAAAILDIGISTAYAAAKAGSLPIPAIKIGGKWMVRTADLRSFLRLDN